MKSAIFSLLVVLQLVLLLYKPYIIAQRLNNVATTVITNQPAKVTPLPQTLSKGALYVRVDGEETNEDGANNGTPTNGNGKDTTSTSSPTKTQDINNPGSESGIPTSYIIGFLLIVIILIGSLTHAGRGWCFHIVRSIRRFWRRYWRRPGSPLSPQFIPLNRSGGGAAGHTRYGRLGGDQDDMEMLAQDFRLDDGEDDEMETIAIQQDTPPIRPQPNKPATSPPKLKETSSPQPPKMTSSSTTPLPTTSPTPITEKETTLPTSSFEVDNNQDDGMWNQGWDEEFELDDDPPTK